MEKNYSTNINNIITLCHIIDDYEEFQKKLLSVLSPKYNRDFVYQLWNISEGKFCLGARKAKRFYQENKSIIDTINKYSNVAMFVNLSYDSYGKPYDSFKFFYNYLLNHKQEISKILVLLVKLKEFGLYDFKFNENLDFTKETYSAHPIFERNFEIIYVANAQVIPNYTDYINYNTIDSNYKMRMTKYGNEISRIGSSIILNSLLFDPNTLPAKLDREHTFEQILNLQNEQKEKTQIIRNSVDLDISVLDLEQQLDITTTKINGLEDVKNKEELVTILSSIKEDVEKLRMLSDQHNNRISKENSSLTPELLEKEKKLYIRRREMDKIDWC